MSSSNYLENKLVDHVTGVATYTPPTGLYAKLHTGDPGEDGTANASAETTRKQVTFGTSSGGSATNTNTPTWTNLPAAESISYASIWDAATAGNCLYISEVISPAISVAVGEGISFNAGQISIQQQ
jgi:hypothetical protein